MPLVTFHLQAFDRVRSCRNSLAFQLLHIELGTEMLPLLRHKFRMHAHACKQYTHALSRMHAHGLGCMLMRANNTHMRANNTHMLMRANNTHMLMRANNTHMRANNTHMRANNTHMLKRANITHMHSGTSLMHSQSGSFYTQTKCRHTCKHAPPQNNFKVRTFTHRNTRSGAAPKCKQIRANLHASIHTHMHTHSTRTSAVQCQAVLGPCFLRGR
jgi:hypothetical protein